MPEKTNFNPRSREGSDGNTRRAGDGDRKISIHAPARGATSTSSVITLRAHNFNPRSREGSDPPIKIHLRSFANFNPRSREGSDRRAGKIGILFPYFNPRSREGSDEAAKSGLCVFAISIHAPARGATTIFSKPKSQRIFQSTLPRGERLVRNTGANAINPISIHAPARGATLLCSVSIWLLEFQSTLPRGERRYARSFRL